MTGVQTCALPISYAAADVVVSRAGALSVSELCLAAKPAIFVPLPSAAEDHQTQNAMSLVNENAGILVKDSDAKNQLVSQAIALLEDINLQESLSPNIKKLAKPNAALTIAAEILKLI